MPEVTNSVTLLSLGLEGDSFVFAIQVKQRLNRRMTVDFLHEMVKEKAGELIGELTGRVGFDADAAERFVPAAGSATLKAVKSKATGLDLANLASPSNITSVLGSVDVDALAAESGVSSSQSSAGIAAILPAILSFMDSKAQGAGGLLALLETGGGLGGAADKLKGLGGFLK